MPADLVEQPWERDRFDVQSHESLEVQLVTLGEKCRLTPSKAEPLVGEERTH